MFNIEKLQPAILGLSGLDAGLNEDEIAIQSTLHDFALNVMRPIGKELDRMTPEEIVQPGSPIFKYIEELWLGRITTLFPPREKYPGSSRLAAVPVSPSEHVLCARKFWLND